MQSGKAESPKAMPCFDGTALPVLLSQLLLLQRTPPAARLRPVLRRVETDPDPTVLALRML